MAKLENRDHSSYRRKSPREVKYVLCLIFSKKDFNFIFSWTTPVLNIFQERILTNTERKFMLNAERGDCASVAKIIEQNKGEKLLEFFFFIWEKVRIWNAIEYLNRNVCCADLDIYLDIFKSCCRFVLKNWVYI